MSDEDTEGIEGISRHDLLPQNGCTGPCEGTGWVPVYMSKGDPRSMHSRKERGLLVMTDETDSMLISRWEDAEREEPAEDGWHFVKCPECDASLPVDMER